MLRYNNQGGQSKPVDYYRPLTVDVSVEYELPKEVAPPKGSAPLLIIHPSAYFRSKANPPSASNQQPPQSQLAAQKSGPAASRNGSGRLGDIASTLYYLSTGAGLPAPLQQPQTTQRPQPHIKSLRSSYGNHHISSTGTSAGSTAITRSRTQAMGNPGVSSSLSCYGNCDECSASGSGLGRLSAAPYAGGRISGSPNTSSSPIKKPHQQQQHASERVQYHSSMGQQQMSGSNGSSLMSNSVHASSGSSLIGTNPGGMNYLGNSVITSNPNGSMASSSNKRLRMMSQQQQQTPHQSLIMHNPAPQPMEPLNLAITPSASNPLLNPSYHQNQFSTFLGYSLPGSGGRVNGSPAPPHGALHYASTFPNNSNAPNNLYAVQSARLSKEVPVPVEKGSGSDSGVCSENDSDVSPPMAPFQDHHRRSVLSQELPSSGCYCCCCPTTSTSSSSRKSSSASQQSGSTGSWSSSKGSKSAKNQTVGSTSNSSGLGNYESLMSVLQQQQHQHEAQFSVDPAMPMSLGNSPVIMDSGASLYPQQRKWFGPGSTPALVMDTMNSSSVGRWFQV